MFETWTLNDCTLYLGDCRDILPTLSGVDCILTDPPYGISHPCNFKTRRRERLAACNDYPDVYGDDEPFSPEPLLQMSVPLITWGANYYATSLPNSSGWLVWDKLRPDTLDQSTCELAWTNCVKGVRRFSHRWHGCMKASERGESYHPTQKPVALMEWCLSLRWTTGFASVCDPYMGSCPTGVACVRTSRRFIGIEKEPRYFEIAKRRIAEEYTKCALLEPANG